jgi:general secretion pathway protein I
LFGSTARPDKNSSGFTLVEVLVALAVMASSLAAIGSLMNATLRSGVYLERHLAEVDTTQVIIAGLPARDELKDGSLSGKIAGHVWRLDVAPLLTNLVDRGSPSPWTPEKIVLNVRGPNGALLTIDMIRLVRARAR